VVSDPLLELTFGSPLYAAVTVCGPPVSVDVAKCATSEPPTTVNGTGFCAWPSMKKVTVPVGVPWYPGAVTTAVNVTCWPTVEGFCDDETVVVEAARPATPAALENAEVFPLGSVAVAV
jgi:hypothetical protein